MKLFTITLVILLIIQVAVCSADLNHHLIRKRSYITNECHAGHMQKALSLVEKCSPRNTVIQIPFLNISGSAQITPTHVSVDRCDGGCHQYGHACLPLAVKMVNIPIMVAQCGIDSGICDKECAVVQIEQHTECSCACQLTADDCSEKQDYRPDLCSCQCHDVLGRQDCLDSGRVWDETECSCGCSLKSLDETCPLGDIFSHHTCSCIPQSEAIMLDKRLKGLNDENEGDDDYLFANLTLEHILIFVLATIILFLLVVLATLVTKIRGMSRRISLIPGHPAGGGGHSLADSDLEVKQLHPGNPVYREGSCSTPSSGFYSEIAANERNYGCAPGKRESDSMYHSAESVRLKKQRMDELVLREDGLDTSSSVSRSRINIIENVLAGEDEGFITFSPEVGQLGRSARVAETSDLQARGSPEGSHSSENYPEFGTVKRQRPVGARAVVDDEMDECPGPMKSGPSTAVQYGKIKVEAAGQAVNDSVVTASPCPAGSLRKVKPPVPPPKSPRIFQHVIGATNGYQAPNNLTSTLDRQQQTAMSTLDRQQQTAPSSSRHKAADISNFATQHIDEALRLLQESANNL